MKYIFSAALCLTLLLTLGAGCGQKAVEKSMEASIENQTGHDVDLDMENNSMTVEDQESGASLSAGEVVEFPDDFPSDIPRYEHGTLKMVTQNPAVNQSGYMIQTADDPEDVVAWFKGELGADWHLLNTMTIQGSTIMSYQSDNAMLSLTVSKDEDNEDMTNVMVSRSEQ